MAPYQPPIAHYAHLNISDYDESMILCMIGKGGQGFYRLTNYLGLEYLWYDSTEKRIELWGSYNSLANGAVNKLTKSLDNFNEKFQKKEIS